MHKTWLLALSFLCAFSFSVSAAEIQVSDNLILSIEVGDGWSLSLGSPPEPLVEEVASHIAHEPAAANATPEQIANVARKRLSANEAIFYHAASGAHLDIDFSAADEGAKSPSARTVEASARYAAQSLEGEGDVSNVDWHVQPIQLAGADHTCLLTATYLKHEEPTTFRGYIGYASGAWFYLYLTAPGENTLVVENISTAVNNASIHRTGP